MFPKWLETRRIVGIQGGTDSAPKPGDYELGSLESRAAARAMLEADDKLLCVLRYRIIGSDEGLAFLIYAKHKETWTTRNGVLTEKKKPDEPIPPALEGPDIFVAKQISPGDNREHITISAR